MKIGIEPEWDLLYWTNATASNSVYVELALTPCPGLGTFFLRRGNQTCRHWMTRRWQAGPAAFVHHRNKPPNDSGVQFMITNSPLTSACLALPLVRIGITDIQCLEVEALENTTNVRMVVDADHHFAFAAAHEGGHPFVILKRKVHPITCVCPYGGSM